MSTSFQVHITYTDIITLLLYMTAAKLAQVCFYIFFLTNLFIELSNKNPAVLNIIESYFLHQTEVHI